MQVIQVSVVDEDLKKAVFLIVLKPPGPSR